VFTSPPVIGEPKGGGTASCRPPLPKHNKKTQVFIFKIMPKVLRDLRFSLNQSLKSTDDRYVGIL